MSAKKKTAVAKRSTTHRAPRPVAAAEGSLNFPTLVASIRQVHEQSAAQTGAAGDGVGLMNQPQRTQRAQRRVGKNLFYAIFVFFAEKP